MSSVVKHKFPRNCWSAISYFDSNCGFPKFSQGLVGPHQRRISVYVLITNCCWTLFNHPCQMTLAHENHIHTQFEVVVPCTPLWKSQPCRRVSSSWWPCTHCPWSSDCPTTGWLKVSGNQTHTATICTNDHLHQWTILRMFYSLLTPQKITFQHPSKKS